MRKPRRGSGVAATLLLCFTPLCGCGHLIGIVSYVGYGRHHHPQGDFGLAYAGVRTDIEFINGKTIDLPPSGIKLPTLLAIVDLPLTVGADTAVLPIALFLDFVLFPSTARPKPTEQPGNTGSSD